MAFCVAVEFAIRLKHKSTYCPLFKRKEALKVVTLSFNHIMNRAKVHSRNTNTRH